MRLKFFLRAASICFGTALSMAALAADWMQFGYDAAHTGNNTVETTITAANVDQIVRRYEATLPASVDSAPVYLSNVQTNQGTKNLLFLLAQDGTLMALDSANGSVVWSHQVSGQNPTTSAPAVDPNRNFVYAYGLDGFVHKYNVGSGTEVSSGGWPELVTLKTNVEKVAGSLTIATSGSATHLYVVNDGYFGDGGDYQGHLTTINLATGAQNLFNAMCSDMTIHFVNNGTPGVDDCGSRQSGIWGRPGATFDAGTNRVYITTGNGEFNASSNGHNWGDSVLALAADGTGFSALPRDSYTPINYSDLQNQDLDLGSVSLAILPVPAGQAVTHLGAQLGKDAKIRLINLDNMSGAGVIGVVGGELQLIDVPQGGNWMSEQPAVWVNTHADGATWLLVANNSGVSGLKVTYTNLHVPQLQSQWQRSGVAKSAIVANGVLYYATSCSGGYCMVGADPVTGNILWTSSETIGNLHWQSPILVNGAIYIADGTHLHRFDNNAVNADLIFQNGFDGT